MNTIENIREKFNELQSLNGSKVLATVSEKAIDAFNTSGIPTTRNEEWKYTRIGNAFNKEYSLTASANLTTADLQPWKLPAHETANELVFVNGIFSQEHSVIRSGGLKVLPLREAAENEFREIVSAQLGHSNKYIKDGIHALNTAFVRDAIFVHVKKNEVVSEPVYIYNVSDARSANVLAMPRLLIYVSESAHVQFVETYTTLGASESLTNEVVEVVVEKDANVQFYKIQNDAAHTNQVTTTNFRQVGKSVVHAVTISLNGAIVRNNLNVALEAAYCEANLFGLYFLKGQTHVDNHTVVDNIKPNCLSNELYKGVVDDKGTAVFNGKIFVEQEAQKTNAFQSNKNVLLSDASSVNTKPQLEIFADDVKCSHGCTVGQLDEEGLFYLQSRGIDKKMARSLLVHAFAIDILEHIKPAPIREYVNKMISERLEFNHS